MRPAGVLCLALLLLGCKDNKAESKPGETVETKTAEAAPEAKPGAPCAREGEALCKDKTAIMSCEAGTWDAIPCRGPDGCVKQGMFVKCDESLGKDGDPCSKDDNYACTTDDAAQLKCSEKVWKLVQHCRGPKGCAAKFPFVNCDTTVAKLDDACEDDGNAACADDGTTVLECKDGKFVSKQKCVGSCKVEGLFVRCR
jgi:hypothetical protein